jgi:hypothetical protein
MGQNLYRILEEKPTPEDIQPYLDNPDMPEPSRVRTPRLHQAVVNARAEARYTADALARNPEYLKLQSAYAEALDKAGAANERKERKAELKAIKTEARERHEKLKSEGKLDEAHEAWMESSNALKEYNNIDLEDLRTKGTDADPYKPLKDVKELKDKLDAAIKDVKKPKVIYPRGMEFRAKWTGVPRKQL